MMRIVPPDGWIDAQAIAATWRRPVATVYRLASVDRWRRIRHAGRTLYDVADVCATMQRLAAGT